MHRRSGYDIFSESVRRHVYAARYTRDRYLHACIALFPFDPRRERSRKLRRENSAECNARKCMHTGLFSI